VMFLFSPSLVVHCSLSVMKSKHKHNNWGWGWLDLLEEMCNGWMNIIVALRFICDPELIHVYEWHLNFY
jgi:hypothetical protein